ncbi:uncharacterized protein LOC132163997 [Corylus avellana]|uniref:uncharacterized protein LOC132163997 n=1 Tax=Corylus avellana TaxID=13451 RepID=UPI00286B30C0|nr:uncharacterized protein LOC132163997 [Corylus avellana]
MAFPKLITALLLVLAFARFEPSTCQVVKAKVSCLDCKHNDAFSGIKVGVKCDGVKKLAVADTEYDGSFEVELPSKTSPLNCHAKLLGGPIQLYASGKNVITKIIKSNSDDEETNSYTISTPLSYSTSCPTADHAKCRAVNKFGSSKTVDLPLPREWGLAPSSYYVPFVPIIGIP